MTDHGYEGTSEVDQNAKTWAMMCHLAALAGFVLPFGNIVGPILVWQIKKNESEFIDYHGKESVNFQITFTIAMLVSLLLIVVIVGIFLLMALPIVSLVFIVIAAIKANNGEWYQYPLTLRLIK